ncbi:hypothetical protein GBA52_004952 [Prunus armeniaca]|nr:hypothetical protein GBA52_004952 [Prunus armeniaca]
MDEIKGKPNPNPRLIWRKQKFRCKNGKTSEDHDGWLLDEYNIFEKACKNRRSVAYDQEYLIHTDYQSFIIDELFEELEHEFSLLLS